MVFCIQIFFTWQSIYDPQMSEAATCTRRELKPGGRNREGLWVPLLFAWPPCVSGQGPCRLGQSSSCPPSVLRNACLSGPRPTPVLLSPSLWVPVSHCFSHGLFLPLQTHQRHWAPPFYLGQAEGLILPAPPPPLPLEFLESPALCQVLCTQCPSQFPQLLFEGVLSPLHPFYRWGSWGWRGNLLY